MTRPVRRNDRSAFSLIELLIVVGLITLLSSLLLIGIDHLQTNSKRQQTRLTFQNLQGMYASYDSIAHLHFQRYADMPCPSSVAVGGGDRTGDVVYMTRDMMALMRTMPDTAAALGKLSSGTTMALPAESVATFSTSPPPNPVTQLAQYYVSCHVQIQGTDQNSNTVYYNFVCIQANGPVAGNNQLATPPPNASYWIPSTMDQSVPVLLDAWGNPIIFVPAVLGYTTTNNPLPYGLVYAGNPSLSQFIQAPDHRPFWASAGPSGSFSKGDDNLYSFER